MGRDRQLPGVLPDLAAFGRAVAAKAFSSYGASLPPLQAAHYLLDMQMAFAGQEAPFYPLEPVQQDRMQALQRAHPARIFGFAAFDPRREDWDARALHSLDKGFAGFKFYPAMGFKPLGNEPAIQARVDAFLDFCIARDLPVFAHCTPVGFKRGCAWAAMPSTPLARGAGAAALAGAALCLGHAGAGNLRNGLLHSWGWSARCRECRQPALRVARPHGLWLRLAYARGGHAHATLSRHVAGTDGSAQYADYRERFFWRNASRYLRLPMQAAAMAARFYTNGNSRRGLLFSFDSNKLLKYFADLFCRLNAAWRPASRSR